MAGPGKVATNDYQIALARKVMEANATGEGISDEECADLEKGVLPDVYVSKGQCSALRGALGKGLSAIVTPEENGRLKAMGLADYFRATLAGPDGMSAFRVRRANVAEMASFFSDIDAIRELGEMGAEARDEAGQVVKILLDLIDRSYKETKLECIDSLGRIFAKDKETLRKLGALKRGKDPDVKAAAILALKRIEAGEVESTPAQPPTPAPAQPKPSAAQDPLGDHGVPALLSALSHSDQGVRLSARSELSLMKSGRLEKELLRCLAHHDPSVRAKAAEELGRAMTGDKKARKKLLGLLDDDSPKVRIAAAKALGRVGESASAVKIARMIFSDPDLGTRIEATGALIALGPKAKDAVPLLVDIFVTRGASEARNAAFLLGKMGAVSAPAVPALVGRLEDPDKQLVNSAQSALRNIGAPHPDQAEDLVALLEHAGFAVRLGAVDALLKMGEKAQVAVPSLAAKASGGNRDARAAAVFLLGKMGKAAASSLPALSRIVNGKGEYKERKAAWDAIKKIDPSSDIPAPLNETRPAVKPPPTPDSAKTGLSKEEADEMLSLLNQARSEGRRCGDEGYFRAAPAVAWNETLAKAALEHSVDMATKVYWDHKGKDGRRVSDRVTAAGYRWRHVGENIALGQTSVQNAVEAWLKSPPHCKNIMTPEFKEIGAAYFYGTDVPQDIKDNIGYHNPIYWTIVFGRKE
ncbi:MAG: HEAT repeat domain-containing protein [Proteobacteria bacterium]|nr:HEAT repeat domain-containing protein [Pseudomonadota bacterium]